MDLSNFAALKEEIAAFNKRGQLGKDPLGALYDERRKAYSLFSQNLSDAEMESIRSYVFCYQRLPRAVGDAGAPKISNFIDGEWRAPKKGEYAAMASQADRRINLFHVAASTHEDVEEALVAGDAYWKSLAWAGEALTYRKHVVKNFSRLLHYFYKDCLDEIRQQIPKTKLEADKDFWEAKRAADHLEGTIEVALRGEVLPPMVPGQSYWRDTYLPAGLAAVVTPMNFIYGIPGIQIIGAYMSGCPFIFKGHPFAGVTNTTLSRMLIAAGADPKAFQKVEGFGPGVGNLATDERVAVVSLTGSADTARKMQEGRGLRRLRFEGGGCNWSWIDDGYTDEELKKIAIRLTYSKIGFGSHKCTTLHGIAGSAVTLKKVVAYVDAEMGEWKVTDPRLVDEKETKIVSPLMCHKAQTLVDIVAAAKKAGCDVVREGGRADGEYGKHSEAVKPVIIAGVKPDTKVTVNWDGRGEVTFALATHEFFMPILIAMELGSFEEFIRFCLFTNSHDLATSLWTRDDRKLQLGRRTLGGMLKENDGTDSALEWEEFGASGIGESGNMGVGEATATLDIYTRRQKGRHLIF